MDLLLCHWPLNHCLAGDGSLIDEDTKLGFVGASMNLESIDDDGCC